MLKVEDPADVTLDFEPMSLYILARVTFYFPNESSKYKSQIDNELSFIKEMSSQMKNYTNLMNLALKDVTKANITDEQGTYNNYCFLHV